MSTPLAKKVARLARSGGRRGRGLVFCVAAGNNNCPVKDLGNKSAYKYRDHSGQMRSHAGPIDRWIAAHPDVVTVSASTSLKTRAAYSSWGAEIDLCAPADNFDDLGHFAPRGLGVVTTDNEAAGPAADFDQSSRFAMRFGVTGQRSRPC